MKLRDRLPLLQSCLVITAMALSSPAFGQATGGWDLSANTGSKTGNTNVPIVGPAMDKMGIGQNVSQFAQSSLNGTHSHNNAVSGLPSVSTGLMASPDPFGIPGLGGLTNGLAGDLNGLIPGLNLPTGYVFGGTDIPMWAAGTDYGFSGDSYGIYTGGDPTLTGVVTGLVNHGTVNYGGTLPPVGTGPVDITTADQGFAGSGIGGAYILPGGEYGSMPGNSGGLNINLGAIGQIGSGIESLFGGP
jgi:hypothetical protein